MINIILFGPPGSGKGTQAKMLAEKYNLVHISTGDLFRDEMGRNTELGMKAKEYMAAGELVPDEVTVGMLKNKVESHPEADGFIFDGFPRTIPQAKALNAYLEEKSMSLNGLISLEVGEEEIVARILNRGKDSGRPDDNDEDIIRNRFEVYQKETSPVFDFYKESGLSSTLNGVGTIDEIFQRLCDKIESIK